MEYLFQEWDLEQDPAEFIGESMAPVRQAAIGPMLVGRELEEINWEPVELDDPRLCPDWLEDFRQFALTGRDSLTLAGRARFERDGDSWQVSLYHEVEYPNFQTYCKNRASPCPRQMSGLSVRRWLPDPFPLGRWPRLLHAPALV